jgi:uncharacterized protein with HEPN domain
MREEVRDPGRLEHILQSISNIFRFMEGKSEDDLKEHGILFFAVVKNVEIIGEAAYMLSQGFKEKHPETPWNSIIAMRHYLVHGYYNVDSSELWSVVQKDLPILQAQIINYLAAVR